MPATDSIIVLHREGRHDEALAAVLQTVPTESPDVSREAALAVAAASRLLNGLPMSLDPRTTSRCSVGLLLTPSGPSHGTEFALNSMQRGSPHCSFEAALSYLSCAQKLPTSPALKAVTLNNLSIYYSRTHQPQKALRCLQRVTKQEQAASVTRPRSSDGADDDVSLHVSLNLTTVLAEMGRHRDALATAQQAVKALRLSATRPDPSLASAAYHNLGCAQERMRGGSGFVRSYRAAVAEAKRGGAGSSAMCAYVEKQYEQAQSRAQMARAHSAAPRAPARRGASARPPASPQLPPTASLPRPASSASAARLSTVEQLYAGHTSLAPTLPAALKAGAHGPRSAAASPSPPPERPKSRGGAGARSSGSLANGRPASRAARARKPAGVRAKISFAAKGSTKVRVQLVLPRS